jgi:hypothetical protein
METKNKKRGFLATIWESMSKTGGCCGSGESCCGPAKQEDKEATPKKGEKESNQ